MGRQMNTQDDSPQAFDVASFTSVREATSAFFGPKGPLAAQGFARRESQVTLAVTIAGQLDAAQPDVGGGWSLAEAPCGTGKSLAYLVPGLIAVLRARLVKPDSKACVLVSTANIALQSQLVAKDIPWISTLLGVPLQGVVLKGRNNYLCQHELRNSALDLEHGVTMLREWAETEGCTGDREDVPFFVGSVWHKVSVQADECSGKSCAKYTTCFAERARANLGGAHVVVVNHTMLSLMPKPSTVSPYQPILLCVDEAHELEDCLRKSRSYSLTFGAVKGLVNRLAAVKQLPANMSNDIERTLSRVLDGLYAYSKHHKHPHAVALFPGWADFLGPVDLSVFTATARLLHRLQEAEQDADTKSRLRKLCDAVKSINQRTAILLSGEIPDYLSTTHPGDWAVWVEYSRDSDRVTGKLSPADIFGYVQSMQSAYPTAVLCSATMLTAGSFDYTRATLSMAKPGVDPTESQAAAPCVELELPSPFDLPSAGLLVVPGQAPSPKSEEWSAWAVQQVLLAVQQARGRTLVLASSTKAMRAYTDALEGGEFEVRSQEGTGRTKAVEWFKANTSGVLVGTRSLFQGVDVSGESCSCVIIDRVPFDPPG